VRRAFTFAVALAAVLVTPVSTSAATSHHQTLSGRLRAEMRAVVRAGVPGVVVDVRRGESDIRLATGRADVMTRTPMRVRDRFKVGSITKTLVATVVLQLAGEGRLALHESVARWLPGLIPNGRHITIRELLAHTSGLFDYLDDPRPFAPYLAGHFSYGWTPRRLVRIGVSHPPLFAPGTAFAYSNTGYLLLGLIVERATGQPLQTELSHRIFRPLDLDSTRLPASQGFGFPRAHGYLITADGRLDATPISQSLFGAAGGIVSTGPDVAKFYRALLSGRLLPPRLLRMMTATVPRTPGLEYGLGLAAFPTPCGTVYGHNGAVPGYYSLALNSRDGRRQAVVLVNSITEQETVGDARAQAAYNRLVGTAVCGR
jgi:D-alanyl-D-alanine carboxypeptidase